MEIILTVLITLGVVSLLGAVVGVVRLDRRVDDLEVGSMDIDDNIEKLREELSRSVDEVYSELNRHNDEHLRNLDRRLDNVWSDIHKLSKDN